MIAISAPRYGYKAEVGRGRSLAIVFCADLDEVARVLADAHAEGERVEVTGRTTLSSDRALYPEELSTLIAAATELAA